MITQPDTRNHHLPGGQDDSGHLTQTLTALMSLIVATACHEPEPYKKSKYDVESTLIASGENIRWEGEKVMLVVPSYPLG